MGQPPSAPPGGLPPRYFETGHILDDLTMGSGSGGGGGGTSDVTAHPPVTAMPPFAKIDGAAATQANAMAAHLESIHQHLRYIYYKFEELENRVKSIESKV